VDEQTFADFHVCVARPRSARRWFKPQVRLYVDGRSPFAPLPFDQAFPMLEWGLNWCVSAHCHQYLIIHAAVVERSGRALILPAPPGSGKSTLTAALVHRGWRLLSDELTLIEPESCRVVPIPRPVSLKNGSIAAIRAFAPAAEIGVPVRDTVKGTVAHMRAPHDEPLASLRTIEPHWVVFPRYEASAASQMTPVPKALAFMQVADQAFNYTIHGRRGFDVLATLIDRCACRSLEFGELAAAVAAVDSLARAS